LGEEPDIPCWPKRFFGIRTRLPRPPSTVASAPSPTPLASCGRACLRLGLAVWGLGLAPLLSPSLTPPPSTLLLPRPPRDTIEPEELAGRRLLSEHLALHCSTASGLDSRASDVLACPSPPSPRSLLPKVKAPRVGARAVTPPTPVLPAEALTARTEAPCPPLSSCDSLKAFMPSATWCASRSPYPTSATSNLARLHIWGLSAAGKPESHRMLAMSH
jgi:hypothetical protein